MTKGNRELSSSSSSEQQPLCLFALAATAELGEAISRAMGQSLAAHEERSFEDGEHKVRPLDNVAGADVFVIQSLHGGPSESVNDRLCRLLFFVGALKDAGAARVSAGTRRSLRWSPSWDASGWNSIASWRECIGAGPPGS